MMQRLLAAGDGQRFMVAQFLPDSVKLLTEKASIQLIQSVKRCPIATSLAPDPINTTYSHQGTTRTPILLLHGFDSSLIEFRYLLPLLAAQNETWAVDLLGFGFTDRPLNVSFSPLAIKIHLYHFWQTLIKRPVILVGASMGGAAAIDFALTYPDKVEKLILIDSVGYTGAPDFVKFLFPPFDYWAVEYLRQRKLKALELSIATHANASLIDLIRCSVLQTEMQGWHESMIKFTKSGGYNFLADRIQQVKHSTLVLWGEFDDMLGTSDAERFHRDIVDSQLIWIRDCKHVPQIEQPQITAQHILRFVA
ncbi:alpha/beta fold hydrolase [Phormidesmis priestleyi]